jgi:hypothetical protein
MSKLPVRWVLMLAALSPAVLPLYVILKFGVDLPFWDEWDPTVVGLAIKAHQHQLRISDFFALHNEHRIVIPRVIYLLVNLLTSGNTIAVLLTTWGIVVLVSIGILLLCRATFGTGLGGTEDESGGGFGNRVLLIWFLCNLVRFNTLQQETWLWGMCLMNVTPILFIVSGLLVARSNLRQWSKCILCIVLATAATFSSGNGMLAWPMFGILLAWSTTWQEFKAKIWSLAALGIGMCGNLALYAFHYSHPSDIPRDAYPTSLGQVVEYVPVFLGNIFSKSRSDAPILLPAIGGCVMLALYLAIVMYFLWLWRKGEDSICRRMLVWIVLGGFSIFSAIMAASSRAGIGLAQANETRYITFSLFLPIALINLVPLGVEAIRGLGGAGNLPQLGPRTSTFASRILIQIPAALAAALILLEILGEPTAFRMHYEVRAHRLQTKAAMLMLKVLPDNQWVREVSAYPIAGAIHQYSRMNEMGYVRPRLFTSANANDIVESDGHLIGDPVGEFQGIGTKAEDPAHIYVAGWAYLNGRNREPDAVFLTYDNERQQPIFLAQPIVAEKTDQLLLQGADRPRATWGLIIPIASLPKSPETLVLNAWVLDVASGNAMKIGEPHMISWK